MNGLYLIKPTSIASTGTSATISANGSVSFTAVSSLSLNGVFSADYDNYMIVMRMNASNNASVFMRLRANGTDNTTASSYTQQYYEANGTTIGAGRSTGNTSTVAGSYATQRDGMVLNIYGPFLSQPTAYRSITVAGYLNAYINDWAATHNQSTAYDGVSFYPDSGLTFTGRLGVYGMVK